MSTHFHYQQSTLSLHKLGVFCGLAAAVWLGSAEAPTKLVNAGFSPFIISMGMVMGAFVARWTIPTLLKGTGFLFQDLVDKPHLIVWALLAGMLWAVGQYAHDLCCAQCRTRHRLSPLEYQ